MSCTEHKNENCAEFFVTSGNISGLHMVQLVRKYIRLRPTPQIHTFENMPKTIETFLKLAHPEEYTGHCFAY